MDQISINWLNPKKSEVVWKEEPLMKNAEMMYHYNKYALLLNYKSKQMEGFVAPTDSRFRKDQRLYEEGKIEGADAEKLLIEEE